MMDNIWFGGIQIIVTSGVYVIVRGIYNADSFKTVIDKGLIKYKDNSSGTIVNQEINNSISYNVLIEDKSIYEVNGRDLFDSPYLGRLEAYWQSVATETSNYLHTGWNRVAECTSTNEHGLSFFCCLERGYSSGVPNFIQLHVLANYNVYDEPGKVTVINKLEPTYNASREYVRRIRVINDSTRHYYIDFYVYGTQPYNNSYWFEFVPLNRNYITICNIISVVPDEIPSGQRLMVDYEILPMPE